MANRRRKVFQALGSILLGLIILVIALPIWLPWTLRSILQRYGIQYSTYERVGYGRFALRGVTFIKRKTEFKAARIEAVMPTLWVWHLYVDGKKPKINLLQIQGWELDALNQLQRTTNATTASAYTAVRTLKADCARLQGWLPGASFTNGIVRFQGRHIIIPSADWDNGVLSGRLIEPKSSRSATFQVYLGAKVPLQASVKSDALHLDSKILIKEGAASLDAEGAVFWLGNRCDVTAQFGRNGWLPDQAFAKSESFRIPAGMFNLEGYGELIGSISARWQTGRFAVTLTGDALPLGNSSLPLFQVAIRANGDTQTVTVEAATLSSPGLKAELAQAIKMNFAGHLLTPEVRIHLSADLSQQRWLALTGNLSGEARVHPVSGRYPEVLLNLSAAGIGGYGLQTKGAVIAGEMVWPWFDLKRAEVLFADGSKAEANAKVNLAARSISQGSVKMDGKSGQNFLPKGWSYEHVSLSGKVSGPWQKPAYSAHAEMEGLHIPYLLPLQVQADLAGEQLRVDTFKARCTSGEFSLLMAGAGRQATNQLKLRLDTLALSKAQAGLLALEKPVVISVQRPHRPNQATADQWIIDLEPFRWQGKGRDLVLEGHIDWPAKGTFSSMAHHIEPALFQGLLEKPLPEIKVDELNFAGEWTNGPVTFNLGLAAQFVATGGTPFSVQVKAVGNHTGLSLNELAVSGPSGVVISGQGLLPLTIEPKGVLKMVDLRAQAPIHFTATTQPNRAFWQQIASLSGISLEDPQISLTVSGTPESPQGKVAMAVKGIELSRPGWRALKLNDLQAGVTLAEGVARVDRLQVLVQGQLATATGEFPLKQTFSTDLKSAFEWSRAVARLRMENAQIAPFAQLFPKLLRPQGTVNLDLLLLPGAQLDGGLIITGAASQPLATLGAFQDVHAQLKVIGRRLEIQTFTGFLGGGRVNVSGGAEFQQLVKLELPLVDIRVHADNIPLVREPDIILRSDLDLTVSNQKRGEPVVSGLLNLRNSVYLRDLADLIPGQVSTPRRRPPYFSVATGPLAGWRLDLAVKGTNFLKVRTPYFVGGVSADFRISGTLKEPVALGEATIPSGMILFPFSNMEVKQGLISLFSDNPFRPQLFITAAGRVFGYDTRMQVTGPADQPKIEFSSTPPLSSEQVLLLVASGQLPGGVAGISTQQQAQRVGVFLGKSFLSKFGVGGGTNRLTIRSGQYITEPGTTTYTLEYKLSKDLSIVADYSNYSGFNDLVFSLKRRIYSK